MERMLVAKLAVLLELHAVRVVALVLIGRIVPLFAIRACQRNDYPHVYTSREHLL
jgi:hypothetical protein